MQLASFNRFMRSQPSQFTQKLCYQTDAYLKIVHDPDNKDRRQTANQGGEGEVILVRFDTQTRKVIKMVTKYLETATRVGYAPPKL